MVSRPSSSSPSPKTSASSSEPSQSVAAPEGVDLLLQRGDLLLEVCNQGTEVDAIHHERSTDDGVAVRQHLERIAPCAVIAAVSDGEERPCLAGQVPLAHYGSVFLVGHDVSLTSVAIGE